MPLWTGGCGASAVTGLHRRHRPASSSCGLPMFHPLRVPCLRSSTRGSYGRCRKCRRKCARPCGIGVARLLQHFSLRAHLPSPAALPPKRKTTIFCSPSRHPPPGRIARLQSPRPTSRQRLQRCSAVLEAQSVGRQTRSGALRRAGASMRSEICELAVLVVFVPPRSMPRMLPRLADISPVSILSHTHVVVHTAGVEERVATEAISRVDPERQWTRARGRGWIRSGSGREPEGGGSPPHLWRQSAANAEVRLVVHRLAHRLALRERRHFRGREGSGLHPGPLRPTAASRPQRRASTCQPTVASVCCCVSTCRPTVASVCFSRRLQFG